jgi:Flp pilus assembly protein TadB
VRVVKRKLQENGWDNQASNGSIQDSQLADLAHFHTARAVLGDAASRLSPTSALSESLARALLKRRFEFKRQRAREIQRTAGDKERRKMLWTIIVILLVLWLLGVITKFTVGGLLHLLLVIALVILIINLITGRRAV